jgi:hypothetical protein
MSRLCTVCSHPNRAAIDRELIGGTVGIRDIAARHRLSKSSLHRHLESHIPEHLAQAEKRADIESAEDLLDRVRALHRETAEILAEARRSGDNGLALRALGRMESQLALVGKVVGLIESSRAVAVAVNAEPQRPQAIQDYEVVAGWMASALASQGGPLLALEAGATDDETG